MSASALPRVGRWLVVIASIGHLIGYSLAIPDHIGDSGWPIHARFHVLQALLWLIDLDLCAALVAWLPLAAGRRWARWALLGNLFLAHGAYFIALAAMPTGGPPQGMASHLPLGLAAGLYALGLALAWKPASPGAATRTSDPSARS